MRAALETGGDVPAEAQRPDFRSMVHGAAAISLRAQEVEADALTEAFAAFGIFGLTAEDWAQMLGAAERGDGPPVDWLLQQHTDTVAQVQRASDEQLMRTRDSGRSAYVLRAIRAARTAPAGHPRAGRATRGACCRSWTTSSPSTPPPRQLAESLAACLDPFLDGLYETLMEQLADNPDLFNLPGNDTGAGPASARSGSAPQPS
ncbi:hypothetical protein AB0M19_10935 [Streptomyces sp. NPDC051920]|uniref:hypothetical protein n=1 Tax=Streptomyces sp. NPDC051920 TaxID=3155523 RepID=UPI0034198A28